MCNDQDEYDTIIVQLARLLIRAEVEGVKIAGGKPTSGPCACLKDVCEDVCAALMTEVQMHLDCPAHWLMRGEKGK